MVLISAASLKIFTKYMDNKLKLKVVHLCPVDGPETDPKCKRIVVCVDTLQPNAPPVADSPTPAIKYLLVVFFGPYAKTPFKNSPIKSGQVFTISRFETDIVPKSKAFKSANGVIIKDFYEPLVMVRQEYDPTIKWLVSLREESSLAAIAGDSDSFPDDTPTDIITDQPSPTQLVDTDHVLRPTTVDQRTNSRSTLSAKKRLKFASSDDESDNTETAVNTATNESAAHSSRSLRKRRPIVNESTPQHQCLPATIQNKSPANRSQPRAKSPTKSPSSSGRTYEYKTLIEVHKLLPVSGKTYCHIYGVLRYRDFKKNTIHLRDEKAFTATVALKAGNSGLRHYPAFRPGDLIRIHRILLAPNSMDIICTDPKDVVVFEAFQDAECFTPINTSVKPTFEPFDRNRKRELEEWFVDDLLTHNLSQKQGSRDYVSYGELAVQVLRITTSRDRSELVVWDGTRPALPTRESQVSTVGMTLDDAEEELIRIINENHMSIVVTVFDQHSMDAQSLKPFDFIVMFNVSIRADRYRDDCYLYTLNSSYNFGKCIRFVKLNSYLGQRLYDKIDEYKVMSAVNVECPSIADAFPSQSFIDDDMAYTTGQTETTNMFSDMTDFEMNFDEIVDVLQCEELFLPVVHIVDIPFKNILFDELIQKGVNKHLYKVKARLINYLPSGDKRDVINVLCTNQDCHHMITLRRAISQDPLIETLIESSKDKKYILNCVNCKESTCVLVFKLIFILQDNKRHKVLAQLFGHNAELFLRATPEEVLQTDTKWYFVERLLNYFCARMSSIDSNHSSNVLNYWILQPSRVDTDDDNDNEFIYQIRTAVSIETADRCVGCNLD